MKKKQKYSPLQLSFFDEVITHKNYDNDNLLDDNWKSVIDHFAREGSFGEKEKQSTNNLKTENNERDLSESNSGERADLHDADQRGHGTEIRPSMEGQGTLRHVEGTAARTIFTDERFLGINSIPAEDNVEVLRPNDTTRAKWNEGIRSQRDGMAGTDQSGWPELAFFETLMDFKIIEIVLPNNRDSNYIVTTSIGESLGERGEIRNFLFDDSPTNQEITKAILDTYKDIVSQPEYANGDFYEQKLHAIAGSVMASVNKNISEEKTIEEPVTNVTNFHSLSAPYENRTFSKKIKYQDNITALDILLKLVAEHRSAKPEEQTALAKYVGWGGLKEIHQITNRNFRRIAQMQMNMILTYYTL